MRISLLNHDNTFSSFVLENFVLPPEEEKKEEADEKEYDEDVLFDSEELMLICVEDGTGVVQSCGEGPTLEHFLLPLSSQEPSAGGKRSRAGELEQEFDPPSSGNKRKTPEEPFTTSRSSRQRTK